MKSFTDGKIVLTYPSVSGMTPGPGIFDQRGRLTTQNTSSTAFRTRREPARVIPPWSTWRNFPPPVHFDRPQWRLDGRQRVELQGGGIRVDGRAEQNLGEEEGVEEIRNRDRFPDAPWPADPGALPGGGS